MHDVESSCMSTKDKDSIKQMIKKGTVGIMFEENGHVKQIRKYNPEYKMWVIITESENINNTCSENIVHILGEEFVKIKVTELTKEHGGKK